MNRDEAMDIILFRPLLDTVSQVGSEAMPETVQVEALRVGLSGATVSITVQVVSPPMAKKWLERNDRNPRRMRRQVWQRYAEDMRAGRWAFPVGYIGFDEKGNLVNGQHTLRACVESGRAIVMLVINGVPTEAVEALDRGLKRALADTLSGRGYPAPNDLQAAVRLAWRWDVGKVFDNKVTPTDAQALDWLARNPSICDAVMAARPFSKIKMRKSVMAAFLYRADLIDGAAAGEFAQKLASGAGLADGDPILKLRDSAKNLKVRKGDEQIHDLALVVKAWNAWITGRWIGQLKWSREGRNREAFPAMCDRSGAPFHFQGAAALQDDDALLSPDRE